MLTATTDLARDGFRLLAELAFAEAAKLEAQAQAWRRRAAQYRVLGRKVNSVRRTLDEQFSLALRNE